MTQAHEMGEGGNPTIAGVEPSLVPIWIYGVQVRLSRGDKCTDIGDKRQLSFKGNNRDRSTYNATANLPTIPFLKSRPVEAYAGIKP
jgi:hypothetical protein